MPNVPGHAFEDAYGPHLMFRLPLTAKVIVGTAPIEAKAGATRLPNRVRLRIAKVGTGIVYWGGSSSITTDDGFPMFGENEILDLRFPFNVDIPIYLVASQSIEVRIAEW